MGLFSKDPNKGWGGKSDKCVFTGYKATGTSETVFGGRVKSSTAFRKATESSKSSKKK